MPDHERKPHVRCLPDESESSTVACAAQKHTMSAASSWSWMFLKSGKSSSPGNIRQQAYSLEWYSFLFSLFPMKRTVSQQVTLALAALWPIPKIPLDIISKGHSVLADLGVYGGVHTLGHSWRGSGDTVCHVEILQYLLWWWQRVSAECSVAHLQQNGGRQKYNKRQVNSHVELHTCNEKNRKKS